MEEKYLLDIGLIILFIRVFNLITEKIKFPKIIGSLLAGVILGPAVLNLVQSTKEIEFLSNISMIFIMFLVGIQTNFKKMISGSKKFLIIALLGIFFPLGFGILTSKLYTLDPTINLFFGLVLTISSVSITIESLVELKKVKSSVGTAILGAGIVDDFLGVFILTILENKNNISLDMLFKLLVDFTIFTIIAISLGFIMYYIFKLINQKEHDYIPNYAIAYAFILSFISEYFNMNGVIGAYIAGLVFGASQKTTYSKKHIEDMVVLFFNPISFASIGLKLPTLVFSKNVWIFIIIYTIVSILDKTLGAGIGANIQGYNNKESLQIGIGMAIRGEISLIIANTCLDMELIDIEVFSIAIISIILTTIISSLILNIILEKNKKIKEEKTEEPVLK